MTGFNTVSDVHSGTCMLPSPDARIILSEMALCKNPHGQIRKCGSHSCIHVVIPGSILRGELLRGQAPLRVSTGVVPDVCHLLSLTARALRVHKAQFLRPLVPRRASPKHGWTPQTASRWRWSAGGVRSEVVPTSSFGMCDGPCTIDGSDKVKGAVVNGSEIRQFQTKVGGVRLSCLSHFVSCESGGGGGGGG